MAINFSYPTLGLIQLYLGTTVGLVKGFSWHTNHEYNLLPFGKQKAIDKNNLSTIKKNANFDICGFDVPVLINVDNSKGIVVIVAQDPLREINHFKQLKVNYKDNIIVGLPFAVNMIMNNKDSQLWHGLSLPGQPLGDSIIENILKKGYSVYITDIHKFYVGQENVKGSVYNPNKELDKILLSEEINRINPSAIFVFGKKAEKFTNGMTGITAYLTHPSGSANGTWSKLLSGKKSTPENKCEYIDREILKYI